jgi:hypothetical protein
LKKILFINDSFVQYGTLLLLHGFASNSDYSVEILFPNLIVHKGSDSSIYKDNSFSGRPYTYSNLLEKDTTMLISLKDAKSKIINNYYDLIVFGQMPFLRIRFSFSMLLFKSMFHKNNVVVIDEEDKQFKLPNKIGWAKDLYSIFRFLKLGFYTKFLTISFFLQRLHGKHIVYYKRELTKGVKGLPFSFSIPIEKLNNRIEKKRFLAINIPFIMGSYIYSNEFDYYQGYNEAYFAITTKKGGWDALRHYEIIVNNCLPVFLEIDECPDETMFHYPKDLVRESNELYLSDEFDLAKWESLATKFKAYILDNLTTSKMATYIYETSKYRN